MTVRMSLPISMGKVVHTDPFTLEPEIDHPILDIGSSYSSVKPHILDWLIKHYGNNFSIGIDGEYYIDFPTEKDLLWFKLKFL